MKRTMKYGRLTILALISLCAAEVVAQEKGGGLTVEGLHQQINHSAAARAFGGVTMASRGDVGLMFLNPASLGSLDGMQFSLGGIRQVRDLRQEQHFAPVRYYPNLSLLLEGLTDRIPDPDPELVGFTPADSVQRPFDDITPDWSRSNTTDWPLHGLLAAPISLGGFTLAGGLGVVQYAHLNYYDQNNNVLDPAVLSQRPLPILRPTDDDPLTADWFQSIRSREGSIRGYGAALAGHVERYNLTIGISGMLLRGESDDVEQRLERGTLTFFANEFRADSSRGRLTRSGTSEFSGSEFTLGSMLHGRFVSIGLTVKPPTKYTRTFHMDVVAVVADTAGASDTSALTGEDAFQLPWRGSVGLLITPRDNLAIGLEYELRPYGSATFTRSTGEETSPWTSSSLFRIGAEYALSPWLVLRGGIRGEADVFIPEGSPSVDEPVTFAVYSAGLGVRFSGLQWNVTYENASMNYQDIFGSTLHKNSIVSHAVTTDISYTIPFGR